MFDYLIIGFVELAIGIAFTFFPPKKINDMYGYWGKSAKKCPEAWQKAHRFAGPAFILGGISAMTLGYYLFQSEVNYARTISLLLSFAIGALVILLTEQKLKNVRP